MINKLLITVLLLLNILLGVMIYRIYQVEILYWDDLFGFSVLKNISVDGKLSNNQEDEIIKRVGKLVLLPAERPKFLIVKDRDAIFESEFFSKAREGDIVLLFEQSNQVMIYDIKQDRLINVGYLIQGEDTTPSLNQNKELDPDEDIDQNIEIVDSL